MQPVARLSGFRPSCLPLVLQDVADANERPADTKYMDRLYPQLPSGCRVRGNLRTKIHEVETRDKTYCPLSAKRSICPCAVRASLCLVGVARWMHSWPRRARRCWLAPLARIRRPVWLNQAQTCCSIHSPNVSYFQRTTRREGTIVTKDHRLGAGELRATGNTGRPNVRFILVVQSLVYSRSCVTSSFRSGSASKTDQRADGRLVSSFQFSG